MNEPTVEYVRALLARDNDNDYGTRPTNDWNSGDLPAPFAIGDVLRLTRTPDADTAARLRRYGAQPHVGSYWVVNTVYSIDEGDAWHVRLDDCHDHRSDRLHIADPDTSTFRCRADHLAPFALTRTADPDGLDRRRAWLPLLRRVEHPCRSCGGSGIYVTFYTDKEASR